ncbi:MAG TPA: amino acid adenylation domain-containing protein, partial [Terrimicrobiaceae bacterium]|nr:amino acid adenylation domain-containing protein [Terrimicrobiaceae bacterium]
MEGFIAWAIRDGGRAAVVDDRGVVTYAALHRRSNQLAHVLRARGVGPGVLVGVAMERCSELLVALFAVVKAGGAYVPLDPGYPAARLAGMIARARPTAILTQRRFADRLPVTEGCPVLALDDPADFCAEAGEDDLPAVAGPDDPLYVIFTSGSTGEPKGAVVKRRGFANLLEWFDREFSVGPDDRFLLLSSPGFDLTQKNFFSPLRHGGLLVCHPSGPFDLTALAAMIERHGITVMNCTPSAFVPLVDPMTESAARQLATLRLVVLGGEPIPIPRVRSWLAHASCHAEIANTYGPTECTDICGFYRLHRGNLDAYAFVPIGGTLPNVQVAVADDALGLCPVGEPGELLIGGEGVGLGYLADAERTRERFVPNPYPRHLEGPLVYRTGDRVKLLPEGVLEFLGRVDHQVKLRGFRIELLEIESTLAAHPEVRASAVLVQGEELVAYVAPGTGAAADFPDALRSLLAERLPEYMVPGRFVLRSSLPLTPNGKVDRLALAATDAPRAADSGLAATTAMETQLHGIWTSVLDRPRVGVNENFFD